MNKMWMILLLIMGIFSAHVSSEVSHDAIKPTQWAKPYINTVYSLDNHIVYVATDSGLLVVHASGRHWKHKAPNKLLPGHSIHSENLMFLRWRKNLVRQNLGDMQ